MMFGRIWAGRKGPERLSRELLMWDRAAQKATIRGFRARERRILWERGRCGERVSAHRP